MRIFSLRYALLGWLVARLARKRLERRLNRVYRNTGRRRLIGGRRGL